jgi:hypothetical protein
MIFQNSIRSHEKRRRRNTFLVRFFPLLLSPIVYLYLSGVYENKARVLPLLTIEPMVEDDYLVYSYLADVFQKPEDVERDASSCA